MFEAKLFAWLQGADFYRSLHAEAVASLPPGDGGSWLDVGCGPGLVSRLAASRGYEVKGIDRSAAMVREARCLGRRHSSDATFSEGDLSALPHAAADVVSAASLLAVLDDRARGLSTLWSAVRPGGRLLIIEPTPRMTRERARRLIAKKNLGRRSIALRMWAAARQGRAVDPSLYAAITPAATRTIPLLDDMVEARIFEKPTSINPKGL